jgi:predicted nuclease of predicted toxin-antitoxin system
MPLMSKKKQPFVIDNDLSAALKEYLPSDARTTVECGLRPNAPDYPDVVDLCQQEEAMLVTADTEFPDHLKRYQREHNTCCWGLVLLPSDELKQIEVLKRIKAGKLKIKHPVAKVFHFDFARHENLFVNLRANPPEVTELCTCEWDEDE